MPVAALFLELQVALLVYLCSSDHLFSMNTSKDILVYILRIFICVRGLINIRSKLTAN